MPEPTNKRPSPAITADTAFWWEGLRAGELRIQKCRACASLQHPPEPYCMSCGKDDMGWVVASGTGSVHSFTVHHQPVLPSFDYPYAVGLIQLDEGTRVIAGLVDVDPAAVEIGLKVKVGFRHFEDDLSLAVFSPLRDR